jgi:serine/threonine-protein kinase
VIGQTIDGKYLVQKLLGEGGMGSVYEAEHNATGRRCAIKVISSKELINDANVVSRFQREARAAGAIDTQYITQVLDAGVDRESGLPFLAMEYMDGEDLQAFLKKVGPVAYDLALRVTAQACLGLQKAHDANVVHRDMKPHNLFLAKRDAGEVVIKLLDFGIAKVKMEQAQDTEGGGLTKTGNLLGSPLYVSPEQARGKRQIDHRTDVWSLGAVMYQMLSGRTPYEHASALGELILMICTEPTPPLQDYAPWVPPEVAAIVHKCLQKDPEDRYASAKELFEACRAMLPNGWTLHEDMFVSLEESQRLQHAPRLPMGGSVPPGAAAATVGGANGASTTGPLAKTATGAPPPKTGASTAAMVGGGLLVVALGGAGVYAMTMQSAATQPPETTALSASAEPEPPPEPSVTASASAAPTVAAPQMVTHGVLVDPADATVEVRGKAATLSDSGRLEIKGEIGESIQVLVKKGKDEKNVFVVLSKTGPVPMQIKLERGKGKVFVPRATSGGAATGGAKTPPPPPAVPTGIRTSEDEFN